MPNKRTVTTENKHAGRGNSYRISLCKKHCNASDPDAKSITHGQLKFQ